MSSTMKTIVLCSLVAAASALPTGGRQRRQSNPVPTVQTHMQNALESFLKGAEVSNFYALANGWKTIDFAGATDLSAGMANNAAFYLADQLPGSNGSTSYSQKMVAFVQDVNAAVTGKKNSSDSPAVTKAKNAYGTACNSGIAAALSAVSESYTTNEGVPPPPRNSPDFLQYAAQDVEYQQANDECQAASNAYEKALSAAYGDDFYIFSGAMNNIKGILNPATVMDGQTMSITNVKTANGAKAGNFVPYYSIPTLNGTVTSWQTNPPTTPSLNYNSSSANGSSTSTASGGGGGVSFIWEAFSGGADAGVEDAKTTSNTSAAQMTVTFGQIGLFGIEYGIWNSLQVAEALQSPSDAISQKGVAVFDKYYGTSDKPGPLARWKDQALVIYQPSFTVQFSTASEASSFHKTQASASACFLFICLGGHGSSTSNSTSYTEGSTTVSYQDPSNKAYLVGFTQSSYFDADKNSDSSSVQLGTDSASDSASSASDSGSDSGSDSASASDSTSDPSS